jgi:hypothetical protein
MWGRAVPLVRLTLHGGMGGADKRFSTLSSRPPLIHHRDARAAWVLQCGARTVLSPLSVTVIHIYIIFPSTH